MSYATGNYGSIEDNIDNPNTGIPLMDEYQRDNLRKYKSDNTSQPSRRNSSDNQSKALEQAQNQAAFDSQARDAAVDRQSKIDEQALSTSGKRDDQVAKSESASRRLIESIDRSKVDIDNQFKSKESALDRNKSSDEFTQNRAQSKFNQAQDRANLEYSTAQSLAKDKQAQDAELNRLSALADKTNMANLNLANVGNAANLNLANITRSTELAGQASAVDRARLAANAQVKAALFAPRQYSGY